MIKSKRARMSAARVALGLALLALTAPAVATTLRRMDLNDLVSGADRVVHARAVDSKVYWEGTVINTDTVFEVIDEAKGAGPVRLTVTMLGGRIDPVEMSAPGTPTFSIGDEVVLFTSPRPDGKKNLVGFTQGHMKVIEPPGGDKVAVSLVAAGVTYVEAGAGGPRIVKPVSGRVPLSALIENVRKMVDEGQPAGPTMTKRPMRLDSGKDRSQP